MDFVGRTERRRRSVRRTRCLAAILAVTAMAGLPLTAFADGFDPRRYIGRTIADDEPDLTRDRLVFFGAELPWPEEERLAIAYVELNRRATAWLMRLPIRDENSKKSIYDGALVLDILVPPALAHGQEFFHATCRRQGRVVADVVVLSRVPERIGGKVPVVKAWRADRRSLHFAELAASGLDCEQEVDD